jgi:hypothetical protein
MVWDGIQKYFPSSTHDLGWTSEILPIINSWFGMDLRSTSHGGESTLDGGATCPAAGGSSRAGE